MIVKMGAKIAYTKNSIPTDQVFGIRLTDLFNSIKDLTISYTIPNNLYMMINSNATNVFKTMSINTS